MTTISTPTEDDVIRTCVALLRARNDEEQVRRVIGEQLAPYNPGIHAAILKVVLRVVVAQFFATTSRRVDHEIGWEFTDAGLDLQEAATNGTLEQADEDDRPLLSVVPGVRKG